MNKPLPKPTAETLPFWQACAQGRLVYQRCDACGRAQFPPRGHCASCHAAPLAWRESARVGTVHSHTTVQRAPTAAFKADVPYAIALVDLDEGFRMMTNVRGAPPDAVRIGARVRIVFEDTGGEWPLPQALLLGETLTFDTFEPGKVYGHDTETVTPELVERWCALYPWDRPAADGAVPDGVATMIATRAYMHVLHPRPPGNVHAGSTVTIHAPLRIGARVTTEVRCTGKAMKGERRFVDVGLSTRDAQGVPLVDATMRLIWAA